MYVCASAKSMNGQRFEKLCDDHYQIIMVITFNNPSLYSPQALLG